MIIYCTLLYRLLSGTSQNTSIYQERNFTSLGETYKSVAVRKLKGRFAGAEIKQCEKEKKKMFAINFTPLCRIIAVYFKHYDRKISSFQLVTLQRLWSTGLSRLPVLC